MHEENKQLDEALRNLIGVLHEQLLRTALVTEEQWNEEIAPALSNVRGTYERLSKRIKSN